MNNEYFAMRRNERVRSGERSFFSVRLRAAYTRSATGFSVGTSSVSGSQSHEKRDIAARYKISTRAVRRS